MLGDVKADLNVNIHHACLRCQKSHSLFLHTSHGGNSCSGCWSQKRKLARELWEWKIGNNNGDLIRAFVQCHGNIADELMHLRMSNYNNKTKNKIKPHTVEKMSWIPRSAKSTTWKLIMKWPIRMFYNADVFLSSFTKPDTLNTIHPYLNQYSMQSHTQSFIFNQYVHKSLNFQIN